MNTDKSYEKKVWLTPTIEELGVDQTLGGGQGGFFENQRNGLGVFVNPFGTIPGTSP